MDISSITPNARRVEVEHPATGKGIGVIVTLLPMDSPEVKKVRRVIDDRILSMRQRGKIITAEQTAQHRIDLITTAVSDWDWSASEFDYKGVKPDARKETIKAVLSDNTWLLDFLDEQLGETKAFFQQ